jgi:hypothetical protein
MISAPMAGICIDFMVIWRAINGSIKPPLGNYFQKWFSSIG